jgi:hypothetical protein
LHHFIWINSDEFSPFDGAHLAVDCVRRGSIPSRDQTNSSLFSGHYFNVSPDLELIDSLVDVRFFSSKLWNPIKQRDEPLLVLGVTGSEDGQNRRAKTDFVVVDRSGSMGYGLNNIVNVSPICAPRRYAALSSRLCPSRFFHVVNITQNKDWCSTK